MAIVSMARVLSDGQDRGSWYITNLTMASGMVSDIYQLPSSEIYAIGATISGTNAKLAFSLNAPSVLAAGTALFTDWNGSADINPAVTAFKMTTTTASGFGTVTVKTCNAN